MGWVWFALVVATIGGATLVARALWRKIRALGRELARAGEVSTRLDQPNHAAWESCGPTMRADDIELRARVASLKARRKLRKEVRTRRHQRTWHRWLSTSE